jgi:hypothetical protein
MPSDSHIEAGLSLIDDKSKVLGLTIGSHENVQPGTWLPRKGTDCFIPITSLSPKPCDN